jgi:hypothetical protein
MTGAALPGPALPGPALPGPVPQGAGAAAAGPVMAQPRLRIVLSLARIEAVRIGRGWLVLGGLLGGVLLIGAWYWSGQVQPLWWEAGWRIGGGQLILAMAMLAAAQLAAGRSRRDGMADLYASFPATAGLRTLALLASLAGAVPASLLMIAAGVVTVQLDGPIGAPSLMVLVAGVVLVLAAGAAGIAIGTRFPHPLAGLFGALVLFLPAATTHLLPGSARWLLPWQVIQDQLGSLPGPLTGYPPAGAHAAELAGLAIAAAIVAVLMTARSGRARAWLAAGGVLAAAVICFAGTVQLEPVPTAELNHLATEMADPASAQHCDTAGQVRYCLYPGFGRELSSVAAPVNKVLALLPVRPSPTLTVRQVLSVDFTDAGLTRGQAQQQISRWLAQTRDAPGTVAATSAIYLTAGAWPASGGSLTDADFNVALAAADWAVGFTAGGRIQPYPPRDEAREAVAIWLAILATHPPAGELQQGMTRRGFSPRPRSGSQPGRPAFFSIWFYPDRGAGAVTAPGPQVIPASEYLLAKAMTGLPERRVNQVLKDRWATWVSARTTAAQLAAALGVTS